MTEVRFKNQAGITLAGRLELPELGAPPFPAVVFAHGFDSGKDSPRGQAVADRLRAIGLATFLIDFTGHGDSQGVKSDATIERQVDDLRSAIDYVVDADDIDPDAVGVNGASSGGLVALMEALADARVKALVLRGPRTDGIIDYGPMFNLPILIIQGEFDPLLAGSTLFYESLQGDKRLEMIAAADHLFSTPDQMEQVIEITSWWFKTRLKTSRRAA
ncbi:MAG: alpha/beta fold hydrolase [Actinomycetota bacterium]|nr:alpha/beta fold hydrolase [Actinomycetota bacterium]